MTRNDAREIAMHLVFSLSFGNAEAGEVLERDLTAERFQALREESPLYGAFPNKKQEAYIRQVVQGVALHGPELDEYIGRYARGWAFARIPRMAAAIMRTSMYEMLYMPDIPNAATINSSVDIARKYEDPKVVSFINGILGSFARTEFPGTPPRPEKKAGGAESAGEPAQSGEEPEKVPDPGEEAPESAGEREDTARGPESASGEDGAGVPESAPTEETPAGPEEKVE